MALAPVGAAVALFGFLARGWYWAAFLVVAAVVGVLQARKVSPRFARWFDATLSRVAVVVGHAAATAVSWSLLTIVFLVAFLPAALVALIRRRPRWGPGTPGTGWTPRLALGPSGSPGRTFGAEPSARSGAPRSRVLTALAVVAAIVVVDLVAGALLTATGMLPGERGELGRELRAGVTGIMSAPAIASEPWAEAYGDALYAFELEGDTYEPFLVRGFFPYRSAYLNTTDRERVSYQPPVPDGVEPLRVAFFGGSVLFGVGQRDEYTIPSAFARLAEDRGVVLEVHDYGFPGWVAWQELQYLERLLAEGEQYDLIVFYDGFNEFHVQETDYSPHPTHNGAGAIKTFAADFHDEHEAAPGLFDGLADLASTYGDNSAIVRVFDEVTGGDDAGLSTSAPSTPEQQQDAALDIYARANRRIVDLVRDEGTAARFFWQPRRIGWSADITARLPAGVEDLSSLFVGEEDALYIDDVHTNERGAALVAEAMWATLGPDLEREAAERS